MLYFLATPFLTSSSSSLWRLFGDRARAIISEAQNNRRTESTDGGAFL